MRKLPAIFAAFIIAGCAGNTTTPNGTLAGLPQSTALAATASGPPVIDGCQIFPAATTPASGENWWNADVSKLPLDPNSSKYIAALPGNLHPDFGENPTYGIPFVVVKSTQKKVKIMFDAYGSESNKGPYPVPPNAPVEGGKNASGDRHVLVLQQGAKPGDACTLYEMYQAYPVSGGKSWRARAGAVWNTSSNALRHNGWTSADAAGLAIFPALIKCDEVAAGVINHALRVTFNDSQAGWISPATHDTGSSTDASLPPMGLRFRLKASFNVNALKGQSKIIATAMQKYGMLMADNGSNWYFQGEGTGNNKKTCWNDDDLDQLKNIPGSDFEVVQTGPIQR
jgi:hypothetical protein